MVRSVVPTVSPENGSEAFISDFSSKWTFLVDIGFETFDNRPPTKILEIKNASEMIGLGREYSQYPQN